MGDMLFTFRGDTLFSPEWVRHPQTDEAAALFLAAYPIKTQLFSVM